MKIKTVIVDDELPICNEIEYLLQAHPDFEVLQKFDQAQLALDYISKNSCDLLFLDINMPGMSGLEFAECVGEMKLKTMIVFVTAYEKYAVSAFATPAVGYLTKPITQIALTRALNKVKGLLPASLSKAASEEEKLGQNQEGGAGRVIRKGVSAKVTVTKEGKLYPVARADIIMAYVKNKEVFVRTKDGDYLSQMNMQEMAEFLREQPFLQVHRQYIINLDVIEEVIPWFHGSYMVHLKGFAQDDIPISRTHTQELKQLLGLK